MAFLEKLNWVAIRPLVASPVVGSTPLQGQSRGLPYKDHVLLKAVSPTGLHGSHCLQPVWWNMLLKYPNQGHPFATPALICWVMEHQLFLPSLHFQYPPSDLNALGSLSRYPAQQKMLQTRLSSPSPTMIAHQHSTNRLEAHQSRMHLVVELMAWMGCSSSRVLANLNSCWVRLRCVANLMDPVMVGWVTV